MEASPEQYSVELSPRMWTRAGAISRERFEQLRLRAAAVAQLASATRFLDRDQPGNETPWAPLAFALHGEWVLYRLDPGQGRLLVLDVVKVPLPQLVLEEGHGVPR